MENEEGKGEKRKTVTEKQEKGESFCSFGTPHTTCHFSRRKGGKSRLQVLKSWDLAPVSLRPFVEERAHLSLLVAR